MTDRVETSLAVDYFVIINRIGRVLANPSQLSKWTGEQLDNALNVMRDGLRQYYQPPAVDEFGPHQWSFMYPQITMKTVTGERWYPALDGFTGEITDAGGITYTGQSKSYDPIKVTSLAHINRLESQESDSTGYPRYVAVKNVNDRGETPQEWQIGFHPTPDAQYEMQYQAYMEPYMLTEERRHPLGGQQHADGILLSCLACAEMYEFGQQGIHYQAFIAALKANIQTDSRRAPGTLGYGGVHRRGGRAAMIGRHSPCIPRSVVTYNNQEWS